jgi:hypothetical protein
VALRARRRSLPRVEIDASCEAFERARALRPLCLTRLNGASLSGWSGEIERGLAMVARSQEEAARLGSGFLASYAVAVKGLLLVYAGDAQAEAAVSRALDAMKGSPRLAFICHASLAHLALARGDVVTAEQHARAAAAIPVVRDLKPAGLALVARVLVARGDAERAVDEARAAVWIQSGCRDLELTAGLAELALAEALDARGDHAGAREALAGAYGQLAHVAGRVASPARRARFWARGFANDTIRDRARAWGILEV